jgi:hypothetical protein
MRTLRLILVSEKAKYFFPRGWTGILNDGPSRLSKYSERYPARRTRFYGGAGTALMMEFSWHSRQHRRKIFFDLKR